MSPAFRPGRDAPVCLFQLPEAVRQRGRSDDGASSGGCPEGEGGRTGMLGALGTTGTSGIAGTLRTASVSPAESNSGAKGRRRAARPLVHPRRSAQGGRRRTRPRRSPADAQRLRFDPPHGRAPKSNEAVFPDAASASTVAPNPSVHDARLTLQSIQAMVNHARSLALQLAQWSLELDHREAELERRRRDLGQQGRIFRQRQWGLLHRAPGR